MYPVLFKIGSIEIETYYVMWTLALSAAMLWANRRIDDSGLPVRESTFVVTWSFAAMLLGASAPTLGNGLSEVGAVVAAIAAAFWLCRTKKISFWRFADALSPCVLLAISIGRWGCFFNGCCAGINGAPVQLDYAFSALTILAIVLSLENRFKKRGQTFKYGKISPIGLGLYCAARLVIDRFRIEADAPGMVATRYALVALIALSIFWVIKSPQIRAKLKSK